MPTPPVRKSRPGSQAAPPKPIQAHLPTPVVPVPLQAVEPVQAQPEAPAAPKKLRIRTRYGYPILVPHLGRLVRPGETAELDDHEWLRRQILLNTFVEV
jgi:hypothetical protein